MLTFISIVTPDPPGSILPALGHPAGRKALRPVLLAVFALLLSVAAVQGQPQREARPLSPGEAVEAVNPDAKSFLESLYSFVSRTNRGNHFEELRKMVEASDWDVSSPVPVVRLSVVIIHTPLSPSGLQRMAGVSMFTLEHRKLARARIRSCARLSPRN